MESSRFCLLFEYFCLGFQFGRLAMNCVLNHIVKAGSLRWTARRTDETGTETKHAACKDDKVGYLPADP